MNKNIVLSVSGLTKKYDDYVAVNDLSIKVNRGEIYGFLGPNGAGKTTTIECILGLKKFEGGDIELLSNPSKDFLFSQVGVQFQSTKYHDHIKVYEVCELFSSLYKNPQNYKQLLLNFGLKRKENQLVSSLSGGEQQRLSIVLALINKPKIVFLDELTTGLDPEARHKVWDILQKLKKEGLTIFLTSHYMDEVTKLCDRITIIKSGKEVVTGATQDVIAKSGHDKLDDTYIHYINKEV